MHRLTMGIHSEKCVIRQFHHCVNIIEFTYPNLDGAVYYTPKLCDTNPMGPLSYMQSIVDRNIIMQCVTVLNLLCGRHK